MANITQTIPSLTAGISQQPDEQKIPGQVKDLENALPDVTHGLLKRPAGKFVGTLTGAGNGKWFHYYRDENEQYIGQVQRNGTVKMWACTQVTHPITGSVIHEAGAEVPVVDGIGNSTYLSHLTDSDIQTLTLNDFTYITNRKIATAMDETSAGLVPVGQFEKEVYVELKAVAYAKQYGLNLFDDDPTDTTENPFRKTITTATRISLQESNLNTSSTCPDVGTEIYSFGAEDNTGQGDPIKQKFIWKLKIGHEWFYEWDSNNDPTSLSHTYRLYYCPPPWKPNRIYRAGDLVTGRPDPNNNNNNQSVYKLKAGSTTRETTINESAPSHLTGDGDTVDGHTWTHITNEKYETDNLNIESSGFSTQLYDGQPAIRSNHIVDSQNSFCTANTTSCRSANSSVVTSLISGLQNSNFPFDLSGTRYDHNDDGNDQRVQITMTWKHDGYYDDHRTRIIWVREDRTENGDSYNPGDVVGGGTNTGDFDSIHTTGWETDSLPSNRKDLYFRITTTGQAVPDDSTTDTDDYVCRYTTTLDLLHGGSGWEEGDQIAFIHKNARYRIKIDKVSTSEVRANLGLIRPTPTSFDTKTTVTADSILGDMRNAIIAETGFDADDVEQIGSGLYIKKDAKFSASTPVGELLNVVTSQVNDIGDLPSQCKHGMVVEVVNSAADEDNHYVQFHGNGGLDGEGVWEECAKPGRKKRFDYSKMPISLIRTKDGNFRLAKLDGGNYYFSNDWVYGAAYSSTTSNNKVTITKTNHGYKVGDRIQIQVGKVYDYVQEASLGYEILKLTRTENGTIIDPPSTYDGNYLLGDFTFLTTNASNGVLHTSFTHTATDTFTFVTSSGPLVNQITIAGSYLGNSYTVPDRDDTGTVFVSIHTLRSLTSPHTETSVADPLLTDTYTITEVTDADNFKIETSSNIGTSTGGVRIAPSYQHPLWEDALVGDDVTNPEPSFIGKPINKMLFFRNRLALLSEENIILSRPGSFFDFFATSAIQFIPSDPIDISASSTYPATLYDGIQVNAGLILFTKNQQFMLTTDSDILSVQTVKINSISTYNFNTATNPISLGTTIGFLDNANKHSRFFEMASALREGEPEVIEQSAVVSRLFDNYLTLISNSRENSVIFFSEGDTSTLYGYKYFDQINQRKLASWFKWTVEGTIKYHCMQDDNLFAVVKNDTTYSLLRFPLQKEEGTTLVINSDYPVHLDYARHIQLASGSFTDLYQVNNDPPEHVTQLSAFTGGSIPTEIANHPLLGDSEETTKLYAYNPNVETNTGGFGKLYRNQASTIITIKGGDFSSGNFIIGTPYTMKVDIPTLYYQKQSGERWVSDTRADTILHRVKLGFGPVGNYKTSVKCTGKADFDQDVTIEKELVSGTDYKVGILDDNNLTTIPIYNRNINTSLTIESTHPTPMTLHNLTWEGSYTDKNYSRV